jgi:hypothetical protein
MLVILVQISALTWCGFKCVTYLLVNEHKKTPDNAGVFSMQ